MTRPGYYCVALRLPALGRGGGILTRDPERARQVADRFRRLLPPVGVRRDPGPGAPVLDIRFPAMERAP